MTPVLMILLLTFSADIPLRAKHSEGFRISVVRQQKFRNKGHHPEINRRVIFRLCNKSGSPVIVYGTRDEKSLDPSGYLIEFDPKTRKWLYPTGSTTDPGFDSLPTFDKDKRDLGAGRCLEFFSEISEFQVGLHFKRSLYISVKDGDPPQEIRSPEFVLK